jgi:zinc/manganese transport system substrate-binding protein
MVTHMSPIAAFSIACLAAAEPVLAAKVKVAASLPDLASIAASVGGDRVEVFAIAKAAANPHSVEVLPSYMIKVSRARVYLKVGMGLDLWADAVIDGSRNKDLLAVDCSAGIPVLEKPGGKVDASRGDVHPEGNPHYWLDPANAALIAGTVRAALAKADPAGDSAYAAGARAFVEENAARLGRWRARMAPLQGASIVTYHGSWAYFARTFGLRVVGHVEPFPGIPPTGRHLQRLLEIIKAEKAAFLIQEPYFPDKDPAFLARQTGLRLRKFAPSCAGPGAGEYWRHFEDMIGALAPGG